MPSPLHEEASLTKTAAALTHRHMHPHLEGSLTGTSYPFKQNSSDSFLIMIYDLSSHGVLTRFTVPDMDFLLWSGP